MEKYPNIRHLRVFSLTARLLRLSRVAPEANLSQPAVTQALAGLERHFGQILFDRRSAGLFLNRHGEAVRARVDRALGLLDEAARRLSLSGIVLNAGTAQLRALVAVARSSGFTEAAHSLGIAQPTLSRAARDVEKLAGVRLFERTSRGVIVNRIGLAYAMAANRAFAEIDQIGADLAACEGAVTGLVVVGAMPLARTFILPKTIVDVSTRHPEARFHIRDGPYEQLLPALRLGDIDLLIGALREPAPADDVVEERLFSDALHVVARVGHPLTARHPLTLDDLSRHAWAVPREPTPTRDIFNRLFAGSPPLQGLIEVSSLVALRGLLLESDRLTIVSRRQILYEERAGLLAPLDFDLPGSRRYIGATMRADWHPTALQSEFLAMLRNVAADD